MNRPFDRIEIEFIPHNKQRYKTCGDWRMVKGVDAHGKLLNTLLISVSELSDWRCEALIAVHELCEVLLCQQSGVSQESVDRFDTEFENHRHPDNHEEPGDDPAAPYCSQHCTATGVERVMAAGLNVSWKEYEAELDSLP